MSHLLIHAQLCNSISETLQDQKLSTRRCLRCLREIDLLKCSKCNSIKNVGEFIPAMVTMPPQYVACKACQEQVRQNPGTFTGWFTCRSCEQLFVHNVLCASNKRQRRCLNCSERTVGYKKNQHTCRKCCMKWTECQNPKKRKRYCPSCRRA